MGDEYVSVEHLFLAMLKNSSPSMKKLFQEYGITRERFLQALSTVRGNQRVTTDNPRQHTTPGKIWPGYRRKSQKPENGPGYQAVIPKFGTLSVSCPVRQKTIRF